MGFHVQNYPLYNIDIGMGYDFKEIQLLVLVLNSKNSGLQQIFDFESKPTFYCKSMLAQRVYVGLCWLRFNDEIFDNLATHYIFRGW